MPRLTFRTKLLLAMALVVAGVSTATLLVTHQRVQVNYERMFRKQFERQVGYFTALQEARLGAIKEQCLKFSQSVRLIAAMDQPEIDTRDLYQIAEGELREVWGELIGGSRATVPVPPRKLRAAFFRFLDSKGQPLPPPLNLRERAMSPLMKRRLESKLVFVHQALAAAEPQQVGYLAVTVETNEFIPRQPGLRRTGPPPRVKTDDDEFPTLQEVIVTKVIDRASGRTLGSLVLGFPLPDLVPQLKEFETNAVIQSDIIQSGILLDDRLYANTEAIPDSLGAVVAEKVREHIRTTHKSPADLNFQIHDVPYRVFYELMNEHSSFPLAYQVCLYSMKEAQREQSDLRWKILMSGGAALAVGLVLSLFISQGLSAPVRDLVAGTGEIQRGNFQFKVPVRSRDEMGQLAESFNEMADGLAQKERYRTVLNMVADEKIARQLVDGRLKLGGEIRDVTILFCDIRGFTALTENMPPSKVIEMLNEHMTALTRVVKQHNGVLDKFVGDLLMAIFGAPVTHGDDALDAARCSLNLLRERKRLNEVSCYKLDIGIGVATGKVVAGCMGSTDRLNYTVLGERVNLASRLCDRAGPGEVWIDQTTKERLEDRIVVETPTAVQLKGFAQMIDAYQLVEVRDIAVKA